MKQKIQDIMKKNHETPELEKADEVDLSILIPAYNAEQYLERCIESVLSQKTSCSFEVILINDGSTDRTAKICEKYSAINNLKSISQTNHGIGYTRNVAVLNAVGTYIMFLDADDYLLRNAIESMMKYAVEYNLDMCQGNYCTDNGKTVINQPYHKREVLTYGELNKLMNYPGFPWGKVIKRKLFKDIRFPIGIVFEDTIMHLLLFPRCKKAGFIDSYVSAYFINENGITKSSNNDDRCLDTLFVTYFCYNELIRLNFTIDSEIYNFFLMQMSGLNYLRTKKLSFEKRRAIFYLQCELFNKKMYRNKFNEINIKNRILIRSFQKYNFNLWKNYCFFSWVIK